MIASIFVMEMSTVISLHLRQGARVIIVILHMVVRVGMVCRIRMRRVGILQEILLVRGVFDRLILDLIDAFDYCLADVEILW